jgi:cation diffusion facilitator CzcD-associated flavoprotein CzcO
VQAVTATTGNDCEVAVIGAGPYGLAAAAHLKSAKIATRVFGEPMSFWRRHMPEGMRLRSPWIASHIAHPEQACSLDAYAATRGFAPLEQMPIDEFIRYGCWFQEQAAPDLDTRKVESVERTQHGFRLRLDDGELVRANRVVVAMGLAHQDFRPAPFAGLPREAVSHSCDHVNFEAFRGKRVAVVGRGQSACESAALLSEAGAEVELICRGPVLWLGSEQGDGSQRRDLAWRVRKLMMTRGAVGPFPLNWLAEAPGIVHLLPDDLRAEFSARCLRAKASGWLRPRFGAVQINDGQTIFCARAHGNRVTLDLVGGSSTVEHVVLATGYKIDIAKLGILAPSLLQKVAVNDGSPLLSYGMESSVGGLHFVGATSVHSFGPLMRFVWGAGYAAQSVTRAVLADRTGGRSSAMPSQGGAVFAPAPKTLTRA